MCLKQSVAAAGSRVFRLSAVMLLSLIVALGANAQESGNAQYQQRRGQMDYPAAGSADTAPQAVFPSNEMVEISIAGLLNVVPDAYVAVFSVVQVGETAEAANGLLRTRISSFLRNLRAAGMDTAMVKQDMISIVPRYALQEEEHLFSRNFNEVPAGFEIQTNLLIRYGSRARLPAIVTAAAQAEIYDLVKVDGFVADEQKQQATLRDRCLAELRARVKAYATIGLRLDSLRKVLAENAEIVYPATRYRSYQAAVRPSMAAARKKGIFGSGAAARVTEAPRTVTSYYEPVSSSGFDVVLNPVVDQAVVQFTYTVAVRYFLPDKKQPNNRYYMLTPNGNQVEVTGRR